MDIKESIKQMKEFQNILLEILEGDDFDNKIASFNNILKEHDQYQKDELKFKSLLLLIAKICNNHHRCPDFINKTSQILLLFKSQIKQNLSKDDIFSIFKGNKRILLFLIENGIFQIDDSISSKMMDEKYSKYRFKNILHLNSENILKKLIETK